MLIERVREMSIEEFLDFAETSEERFEFIDGEICPMTGGTLEHFDIVTNVMDLLQPGLAGKAYRRYSGGMLVKANGDKLLSPDVIVVAGRPETESNRRVLLNPLVVVEVTSPTSADYDRNEKADYYFDVPSIQACLVIEQERLLVELYTRGAAGWNVETFADIEDEVPLATLDCRLPLRDIYANIDFEAEATTGA